MIKLSETENSLFEYVKEKMGNKNHIEFDFNDPKLYEFAKLMTNQGFDTNAAPGKLKALELQKEQHLTQGFTPAKINSANGDWTTGFNISGIGIVPGANIVGSNGQGTVLGGYSTMNLNLLVQDNVTHKFIATGSAQDYAGQALTVKTNVNPQGSSNMNVTSYLYYSYTPTTQNGEATLQSSGFVKLVAQNNGVTADPAVTHPAKQSTNANYLKVIRVGINRPNWYQGGTTDLDYCWYDSNSVDKPLGRIPLVGSVIFDQPIMPLVAGSTINLTINVTNTTGGGIVTLNAANLANVYTLFSIDAANPNKLNWNLTPATSSTQNGNPITFNNISWPADISALFYCFIAVVLQNGNPGFATIQSQTAADDDPLDGTTNILPISFVWHCLGENSKILMSNGSLKPIAEITVGDKVMSGDKDNVSEVYWTNKGAHFGDVYKIKTNGGDELMASHNHIIFTSNGSKRANEIRLGDTLKTMKGGSKVISIELVENYNGMLYNFATTNNIDYSNNQAELGSFVANGIVVGDVNAQSIISYQKRNDVNWVKSQLPAYMHQDVESYFKTKK